MKENLADLLESLEREHQELQFSAFSSETALSIGQILMDRARNEKKAIAIDVSRAGHQLFHYAFDGTRPDNDEWIKRKNRTVGRFARSSYYMGVFLRHHGLSLEERYFVSPMEYSVFGGGFPIIIRDTGVVGTITVSGLPHEDDHRWVVEAIRSYLTTKGK